MSKMWLDTETTGLVPATDDIYEFGYLSLDKTGTKVIDKGDIYMKPNTEINPYALATSPLSRSEIYSMPDRIAGEDEILEIFKRAFEAGDNEKVDICGYNVDFDIRMLSGLFKRRGWDLMDYANPYDAKNDVYHMINKIDFKRCVDLINNKLTTVAEYFGLLKENAHNAFADITMTIGVDIAFRKWFKSEYIPRIKFYKGRVMYKSTDVMDIGKYKGRLVSEILVADRRYLTNMHNKKYLTLAEGVLD